TDPDIDTTTPMGNALFGIVSVFAQLRVDTLRENTMRGLTHARDQSRLAGRPTVSTPERTAEAAPTRGGGASIAHFGKVLGVGKSSVSRALAKVEDDEPNERAG